MAVNKKILRIVLAIVFVFVGLIIFLIVNPFFTLYETDIAVITRFGKVKRVVNEAGLHVRAPFVDRISRLPKRILEWDGETQEFMTYDKRTMTVDTTARWRIKDPKKFYESVINYEAANSRLDDLLDSASRDYASKYFLEELIRSSSRLREISMELDEIKELAKTEYLKENDNNDQNINERELVRYIKDILNIKIESEEPGKFYKIILLLVNQGYSYNELINLSTNENHLGKRVDIAKLMHKVNKQKLEEEMGIEIINMYIKKITYVEDNLDNVYKSMIAEREKFAQEYRSNGQSYRNEILGDIDKSVKQTMANAKERAKTIRGEADAKATAIYNKAYGSSRDREDFYEFIKKMEMYKKLPTGTTLIISTDSEFFDYFKDYQ